MALFNTWEENGYNCETYEFESYDDMWNSGVLSNNGLKSMLIVKGKYYATIKEEIQRKYKTDKELVKYAAESVRNLKFIILNGSVNSYQARLICDGILYTLENPDYVLENGDIIFPEENRR